MIIDTLSEIKISTQTGDYTVTLDDINTLIRVNSSASHTIFIPTNASVAFNTGVQISLISIGTGVITIQASNESTTTIGSTGSTSTAPVLRAQYSAATLIKADTDLWYVVGDLA